MVYERRGLKDAVVRLLPFGAALLPVGVWVAMYLKQQSGYVLATTAWIPNVSVRAVTNLMLIFFGASYDFPGMAEVKYGGQLALGVVLGVVGLSYLAVREKGLKQREKRLIAFSLILIAVYFLSILGAGLVMKRSFFLPKMFVVLATPVLILQVVLVVKVIETVVIKSKRTVVYGLLGVCFAGVISYQMVWVNKGYAYKWISTIPDAVDRAYNQGDQIVFVPHYRLNFLDYFWRYRYLQPSYYFVQQELLSILYGDIDELVYHCDGCEIIVVTYKDVDPWEKIVERHGATYSGLRALVVDTCKSNLKTEYDDKYQLIESCVGY